jgi:hypothetical protein
MVGYKNLVAAGGSFHEASERAQLRLEDRDCVVRDGVTCYFRFTVWR